MYPTNGNINKLKLNPYSLSFLREDLENDFKKDYFLKSLPVARISLLVVSLLYLGFGFLDLRVTKDYYEAFLFIRFAIVIPALSIAFLFSYFDFFEKIWQYALSICFFIAGIGIIYMVTHKPDNLSYYGGLFLVYLAGFFFIKLRFLIANITGLIVLISYNIFAYFSIRWGLMTNEHLFLSNSFYLATFIIASFSSYHIEKLERREFFRRQELILKQEEITLSNVNLENKILERTREMKIAKEKAEESSKLKTEFLNNLSHEVRTPLNGIIGFSDLLHSSGNKPDKQKHYSFLIRQSSLQLLEIIDEIIEISTLKSLSPTLHITPFPVEQIIKELNLTYSPIALEKKISFIISKKPEDETRIVYNDKYKLISILKKLIDNAFKFTTEGRVELNYRFENNKKIIFQVSDTGMGILPAENKIIFKQFRQGLRPEVKEAGGMGLGLSIAMENTKLLNGEITYTSQVNKGSTFIVTIPLADPTENDKAQNLQMNTSAGSV